MRGKIVGQTNWSKQEPTNSNLSEKLLTSYSSRVSKIGEKVGACQAFRVPPNLQSVVADLTRAHCSPRPLLCLRWQSKICHLKTTNIISRHKQINLRMMILGTILKILLKPKKWTLPEMSNKIRNRKARRQDLCSPSKATKKINPMKIYSRTNLIRNNLHLSPRPPTTILFGKIRMTLQFREPQEPQKNSPSTWML